MGFEKELETARRVAVRAGALALKHQARGLRAEDKPDLSPVTQADRECERLIARLLDEAFPADGLLGEEGAQKPSRSGRRWIIDPIDGTCDFLRGNPCWAVLIALEAGKEAVAGVCFQPVLREMFSASVGSGAYRNGDPLRVSSITDISRAVLCVTGLNEIAREPYGQRLVAWMGQFWAARSMGGSMDAMLVAAGKAEAWIEPAAEAWDLAPLKVILEEAGARFFNFGGGSSIYGGNCVGCVPAIEPDFRRFFSYLDTRINSD